MNEETTESTPYDTPAYLNDLMRGRELSLGLETPSMDRPQIVGREEELKKLWLNAPEADREYIRDAIAETDRVIEKTMPESTL